MCLRRWAYRDGQKENAEVKQAGFHQNMWRNAWGFPPVVHLLKFFELCGYLISSPRLGMCRVDSLLGNCACCVYLMFGLFVRLKNFFYIWLCLCIHSNLPRTCIVSIAKILFLCCLSIKLIQWIKSNNLSCIWKTIAKKYTS